MSDFPPILARLMEVIADRKRNPQSNSYTNQLLTGGIERIAVKILEEAGEVVEAGREPGTTGQQHLVRESADLIYHLLVMLACRDATLEDVEAELARRFGMSGLDEKSSRRKKIEGDGSAS